ncbi:ATP-binding cassette domain-containing protein [Jannaschia sp. 2305UL9-9]|uniref:ATP-binding cassette domain-containing protein n=1 Tax=Jannaschia sp. 2305UL9-9 TaxID=3121638 RepID=UPI0035295144
MIEIQTLDIRRDGAAILDGLDLSLPHGGLTAVIGPNGAGKSTLLHAMAGLLVPNAGSVRIGGLEMARAPARERARTVALLAQTEAVTARLTVAELVAFGRWPHHGGRPRAADRAAVAEALSLFELEQLSNRLISTLSGGQRSRAFTAMVHVQATPWMLLDEPLAALDPRHARDLMERLAALSRPPGDRSIVVVLHDLAQAARHADRIVALKDGRLVAAGPADEVLTDATLSDLFDTQLRVVTVLGRRTVIEA